MLLGFLNMTHKIVIWKSCCSQIKPHISQCMIYVARRTPRTPPCFEMCDREWLYVFKPQLCFTPPFQHPKAQIKPQQRWAHCTLEPDRTAITSTQRDDVLCGLLVCVCARGGCYPRRAGSLSARASKSVRDYVQMMDSSLWLVDLAWIFTWCHYRDDAHERPMLWSRLFRPASLSA